MFDCTKCNKTFKTNYLLQKHLNRIEPCIKEERNVELESLLLKKHSINVKISKYKKLSNDKKSTLCVYCRKDFSTHGNMKIHQTKSCKSLKELIKEKELVENNIKNIKENVVLKNNVKNKDNEKNAKIINNIVNNNITNNITNNINVDKIVLNIINFGEESLEHLTNDEIKEILNKQFTGFYKLIEKVHFNENKPEYNNVYIPNIRYKDAFVYKNNKWILKDRDDVIDEIKDTKINLLDKKVTEMDEKMLISDKLKEKYDTFYSRFSCLEGDAKKNLDRDIKYMLYSNRDKAISLKQK
jgi:hypothetical protein